MDNLKLITTNLGIIIGSAISWLDTVDSVLKLVVTIGTIVTIVLTIDKLIRERNKSKPN